VWLSWCLYICFANHLCSWVWETACEEGLIKDSTIECKVGGYVLTSYGGLPCGYHVLCMHKNFCVWVIFVLGIECFLGKIVSLELAYKFLSNKIGVNLMTKKGVWWKNVHRVVSCQLGLICVPIFVCLCLHFALYQGEVTLSIVNLHTQSN
jgi:hypothetical protein